MTQFVFVRTFIKSAQNLIIFCKQIAKMMELCKVHSVVHLMQFMSMQYRVKRRCFKLLRSAKLLPL